VDAVPDASSKDGHKKAMPWRYDLKYRFLIENANDISYISDCDGNLTYISPQVERYGLKDSDLIGRRLMDLAMEEDRDHVRKQFEKTVETRSELTTIFRVLCSNKKICWLEEKGTVLEDTSGRVVGVAGIIRDITERKKIDQELRNANMHLSDALREIKRTHQQTIQHERLSALGTMASGIAHDFNNSLVPILGFSELLLTNPEMLDNKEDVTSLLKDILTAATDASQSIQRLREFYRTADESEQATGDLNAQIETAIILTRPKWKAEMGAKGLHFEFATDLDDIPPVRAKESQLREVLINLILNAVDATPRGGLITMHTRHSGKDVILEVEDQGEGMNEETKRRCLEPFFSTKGEGGTGLGLAMIYGFVQRHRGRIDFESELGKGTIVRITLPCKVEGIEILETEAQAIRITEHLKILVIDDKPAVRKLLTKALTINNHTVVAAENGSEGLNAFSREDFDLVITDRAMPDMSGDNVAKVVKSVNPEVPVILLTGFGDIMEDTGRMPEGIDIVLGKPVSQRDLTNAIAKLTVGRKKKDAS
jgi:PAS domain S-box-containing protein